MNRQHMTLTQVVVETVRCSTPPPQGVAAFAIDTPRNGDHCPGKGLEITGWIIGTTAPVQGVRTTSQNHESRVYPLDVLRPDVASDYPGFGHSEASGFSAWAALGDGGPFDTSVDAVLANGNAVTLATVSGTSIINQRPGPVRNGIPLTAPDFVIIGAQRGGTTSLHAWLTDHPRVMTPATKELHYFTDRHERGLDWYLGQFPACLPNGAITGEATPYALFHPLAPERLRQTAPATKLIVLLRNPVDRAYSHYVLERSRGFETLDFSSALDAERLRISAEEDKIIRRPYYVSEPHKHASYLARGDYAPQLERWLTLFPREQILVVRSEDLYERPRDTLSRVSEFLGIAPASNIDLAVHNRGAGAPLAPAIRDRLAKHFAPKNARLESLLGWSPAWD